MVNNSATALMGWTIRFCSVNITKPNITGNFVNETYDGKRAGLSEAAFPYRVSYMGWYHNESAIGNHVPFYRSKQPVPEGN